MTDDKGYNEAAAQKLAEQWAVMWNTLVISGNIPPKDATKILRTYLKATFGHTDWGKR